MLSIHQPNSRILELFDHVMLLGNGAMNFFGTVPQSLEYFTSIGFTPPKEYTPTDFYLQITDINFGTHSDFDFEGSFGCSVLSQKLIRFLDKVKRDGSFALL
jgi:ABC-type multidrug transport system ATPase subunit